MHVCQRRNDRNHNLERRGLINRSTRLASALCDKLEGVLVEKWTIQGQDEGNARPWAMVVVGGTWWHMEETAVPSVCTHTCSCRSKQALLPYIAPPATAHLANHRHDDVEVRAGLEHVVDVQDVRVPLGPVRIAQYP
jgi:hypothetical protein